MKNLKAFKMKNFKLIYIALSFFFILFTQCSEDIEPNVEKRPTIILSKDSKNPENGKTEALVNPSYYGTYNSGDIMNIEWDFLLCGCDWTSEYINIDLYKGTSRIGRIASAVPFFDFNNPNGLGEYDWTVSSMTTTGSNYKIRITNTGNSSEWAESGNFTLATPTSGCYNSYWNLTGAPTNGLISNNTTVQYKIREDGMTNLALANAPVLRISSNQPINVIYNGVTYYTSGTVDVPITASVNCSGTNPVINAPLKFQKIGGGYVFVSVLLNSVTQGHLFYHGYHSFYVN